MLVSKARYDEMLETLAEQEHEQWMDWSKNLVLDNGVSDEVVCRWRPKWIPYRELSEDEKDKDRVWARKVLELLNVAVYGP